MARLWVVAKLRRWDDAFEPDENSLLHFPIQFRCESVGFLEVFDDYDKALAAAGGSPEVLWEIKYRGGG